MEMTDNEFILYQSHMISHVEWWRQTFRNNTHARTPIAHFLPFLDNVLEQVNARFNGLLKAALRLLELLLIPANLQ